MFKIQIAIFVTAQFFCAHFATAQRVDQAILNRSTLASDVTPTGRSKSVLSRTPFLGRTPAMDRPTDSRLSSSSRLQQGCCPIIELRQYTLHPGKRDVLIELFDREFVESQETLGMNIVGQFRDLADPNRFVWLRGFRDMTSRAS